MEKKLDIIFLPIEAGLILRIRCCGNDILPPYPDWIEPDVTCKCPVCGKEYDIVNIFEFLKDIITDFYLELRIKEKK